VEACDRVRFFIRASQAALVQIFAPPPMRSVRFCTPMLFVFCIGCLTQTQSKIPIVGVGLLKMTDTKNRVYFLCQSS
jgi:hypothetical protein